MITTTVEIRGRQYKICQESLDADIYVHGQVRNSAGLLWPRLLDDMNKIFQDKNIPAGDVIDGGQDCLILAFHPFRASRIAYQSFKDLVKEDPEIRHLQLRIGEIQRRFRQARLAGLDLSRQKHYREPLKEIAAEIGQRLDALVADFCHPYKEMMLANENWKYWLSETHDPFELARRLSFQPGDREWLAARALEVTARIARDVVERAPEDW